MGLESRGRPSVPPVPHLLPGAALPIDKELDRGTLGEGKEGIPEHTAAPDVLAPKDSVSHFDKSSCGSRIWALAETSTTGRARSSFRALSAVTHRVGEATEGFSRIRVQGLDEPYGRINRTLGVLVSHVAAASVSPAIAHGNHHVDPSAGFPVEFVPEDVVPP